MASFRKLMMATALSTGALGAIPAAAATLCPTGPTIGGNGSCDFVITFNVDGTTTTAATSASGSSIGGEDAIIGVINNSTQTVTSFSINGGSNDIFGFDGDGIDTYTGQTPNAFDKDQTLGGYGGPIAYFTNVNASNTIGTVNFIGGVASGASTYFSLEDAIQASAPPVISPPVVTPPGGSTPVPEPSSLLLLSLSLFGVTLIHKRLNRKSMFYGI